MGRGINILVLAISLAFVATGIFVLFFKADSDANRLTGVTVLLFFGGCALTGVAQLMSDLPPPYNLESGHVVIQPRRLRPLVMGVSAGMWSATGLVGMGGDLYPPLLCWALLLFGAIGVLAFAPLALNFFVKIEVDREGFWDHRLTRERVRWNDIEFIRPEYSGYARSRIVVHLKDLGAHAARPRFVFWRASLQPAVIRPFSPAEGVFFIADAIQHFAPPELLPPPVVYDQDLYEDWDDDDW